MTTRREKPFRPIVGLIDGLTTSAFLKEQATFARSELFPVKPNVWSGCALQKDKKAIKTCCVY
jgi:hypothetical protein